MYVLCVLIYCGFRLFTNEYIVIKPMRGAEKNSFHTLSMIVSGAWPIYWRPTIFSRYLHVTVKWVSLGNVADK